MGLYMTDLTVYVYSPLTCQTFLFSSKAAAYTFPKAHCGNCPRFS